MPVRKDVVDLKPKGWAKDPKLTISNGPFIISEYVMNDKIILIPNENYWNKGNVKLTRLTAYDNNEIDVVSVQVPTQEILKRQMEELH
jgi:ABC-type oligopeptide transport system substrate-binding subunit